MKILKGLIYIVFSYLFILVLGFIFQKQLIFHPGKLSKDFPFDLKGNAEEAFIQTADGENINALFYPGDSPICILYFHGNAGDLSGWQFTSGDFTRLGYNFLIIDYRGYGKSTGTITESGLYQDAEAAWHFLADAKGISPENIIIYGRSIGSGIAVELATHHKSKGLILEAPFTSMGKLATQKMPFLLPFLFLRFDFNNFEKINHVKGPVLFIHGSHDSLIPPTHSNKLFEKLSGKKQLIIIDRGTHNDVNLFEGYHQALQNTVPAFFQ